MVNVKIRTRIENDIFDVKIKTKSARGYEPPRRTYGQVLEYGMKKRTSLIRRGGV